MTNVVLKPIIKYAGGKRQIMSQLMKHFPKDFNNYFEPFFGGGSVLFELANSQRFKTGSELFVSDISESLMNIYIIIKNYPDELITELKSDIYKNNKTCFYEHRSEFNKLKACRLEELSKQESIRLAALYIYLNRVCFNGMYRENRKGEYNVPFGKQNNPVICNEELIKELSLFFNKNDMKIMSGEYEIIKTSVKRDDFIYLDPPYYDTFTSYTKNQFGKESQIKLMEFYRELTSMGCKVALSNSDTEFIRNLYSTIPGVTIIEIDVKRVINSKSENRKKQLKELLIVNYQ